jgi:hypothetical protein
MNGLKRYIGLLSPLAPLRRRLGPLKRYIGPGLAISVLVHLAPVIGGAILLGATAFRPVPPEVMEVEMVPLKDAPGFGPMSKQPTADGQAPTNQTPPPKSRTEQTTERQEPKPAAQRLPAPEAPQADLARADPDKENAPPETQPDQQQPTEATPEQPNIGELASEYAKQGGLLGGFGHEEGEDITLPFRERLLSCSKRPPGIVPGDRIIIRVRITFNQDGSLSSKPRLLVPSPSAKQRALMASVTDALETCQPFSMLPPDKYGLWKTLTWYVGFPVDAFARAQ